ncbi:F-box/LRR-repeat protein 4-like [Phlebotomus argentipes]|uniref:F-box/LRR-repeat protein 4-like n=1 Tax=Phlebotomus argentipes TaxID=94469 RepID=UPI002892DF2A|nr:F-box/LRR-repeat protein 4-like [Phlebotomus argentipes]
MLLRASLTNYDPMSPWSIGPPPRSCGPSGQSVAQFAKSIVFSSIRGKCDNSIFSDLNEGWQEPPTRTDNVNATYFSPRKFGTLWERLPSAFCELPSKDESFIPVQDFFVAELRDYVVPTQITIDQVVNPGAVTKIWLYNVGKLCWHLVWCKPPTSDTKKSRVLCISFKNQITFGTRFLRVEMNQSKLRNHTQIGLIEVFGEKFVLGCSLQVLNMKLERRKNCTLRTLRKEYEKCSKKTNITEESDGLEAAVKLRNPQRFLFQNIIHHKNGENALTLLDLPYELQTKICTYLDLKTLFTLSSVSKKMYNLVTDPMIYREVNLRMYWHIVNDEFLLKLANRATKIRKLDISWCGWHSSISPSVFIYFVRKCCQRVSHLWVNSCIFLTVECLHVVASVCEELREFSLHGYGKVFSKVDDIVFSSAKHMRKLDFYRTQIHESVLERILASSGNSLRHLGLAGGFKYDLDRISRQIAKYNRDIVSLDFYQSRFLTHIGLIALSHCHKLEEIDFGWCFDHVSYEKYLSKIHYHEVWESFFKSHRNLRKVFLVGTPKFDEFDVESMRSCENMEQIDLKNIRGFSSELLPKFRAYFANLQYFSISIRDPTLCTPAVEEPIEINSRHNVLPSNYITVARHFKPKTS